MSRQVWGTYSVKDHCKERAFVADVMLFDRLVIPFPPDEEETRRWEGIGWQPDRQKELLDILKDRAIKLPWDKDRKSRWRERYEAGRDIARETNDDAFQITRNLILEQLPRHITGVTAISSYPTHEELTEELALHQAPELQPIYGGELIGILGKAFLVPENPDWSDKDMLKQALELSSNEKFVRKRASFWRWVREFFDDKGITDQVAIKAAVAEMQELIADEQRVVKRKKIHTITQYAFLVGSVTLGMVGGPLGALGIGGAFVSIGQFISDKLLNTDPNQEKPASLFVDARKHFGWTGR